MYEYDVMMVAYETVHGSQFVSVLAQPNDPEVTNAVAVSTSLARVGFLSSHRPL